MIEGEMEQFRGTGQLAPSREEEEEEEEGCLNPREREEEMGGIFPEMF